MATDVAVAVADVAVVIVAFDVVAIFCFVVLLLVVIVLLLLYCFFVGPGPPKRYVRHKELPAPPLSNETSTHAAHRTDPPNDAPKSATKHDAELKDVRADPRGKKSATKRTTRGKHAR